MRDLTTTELVAGFREAVIALYPALLRVQVVEPESEGDDDFDEVIEPLWNVMVAGTLMLQHELARRPKIPPYGHPGTTGDGRIDVRFKNDDVGRFTGLLNRSAFGSDPFGGVCYATTDGRNMVQAWAEVERFEWIGPSSANNR